MAVKFFVYVGLLTAMVGCNQPSFESVLAPSTPAYEIEASALSKERAAKEELRWSPFSNGKMTWREAWTYCESLPHDGTHWWRLASAHEQYAAHGYSLQYPPSVRPGPDRMWSGLWREGGTHYAVNVANGAKTWFGDDDSAYVECVSGYSAKVDPDAWIVEAYNARVMNNPQRATAVIRRMATAGLPAAQLELGTAYVDGNGVARDLREARKWYTRLHDKDPAMANKALRWLDAGAPADPAAPAAAATPAATTSPTPAEASQVDMAPVETATALSSAVAVAPALIPFSILVKVPVSAHPGELTQVGVTFLPRSVEEEKRIDAMTGKIRQVSRVFLAQATHGERAALIDNQELADRLLVELRRRLDVGFIDKLSLDDVDAGAD